MPPFLPPTDPMMGAGMPMARPMITPMPMPEPEMAPMPPAAPTYTDEFLLEEFERRKKEAMDQRWVWEREWLRDLFYVANRQWITYHPTRREWIDKRLHKWVPRPVTNKIAEILQAIRTNFAAINLSVQAHPIGTDTESIATAEVADQMAPLIHEEHDMPQIMREADFWFIATGSACLQTSWERDAAANKEFVPSEQCVGCSTVYNPKQLSEANNMCPACGSTMFAPAKNPDGTAAGEWRAFGRGKTMALSPFEYAMPSDVTRWDELPYIIRMRWRTKHWFEANQPMMVPKIAWEKSPSDRSLQIFKSLALQNDAGIGSNFAYLGAAGTDTVEGVTEYELWIKPTSAFPEGYVMRVLGDRSPVILHIETTEAIPGPIPYKDIEGNPLFPFMFAQYEHMGGRLYGRSAISPLIQKQDQLNQLDSLVQLMLQRTASPSWVIPENAGIDRITGEPGIIIKWNALAAGGQAKPELVSGSPLPGGLFELRAQILRDMEELSGAFDIIKGQKPTGVEAFSALQLLVERSQSRFTSAFQARGEMYRRWFSIAIELERQFGPERRTRAIVGNNKGFTFKHFENAQLQGQIAILIEDGSNVPKTSLGKRAAIEQASNLRLLDPSDPEQRQALLATFGLSDLIPSLNYHINTSATIQDAFEQWAVNPVGPSPLVVKLWFDAKVHWSERVKWLNTDKMRELLAGNPALEPLVIMHLQELQMMLTPAIDPATGQPMPTGGGFLGASVPQGTGMAMINSNRESGATDTLPRGTQQVGPTPGPV